MRIFFLAFTCFFSIVALGGDYESQFPQYFEYCTASQLQYQKEYFDGAEGGKAGHSFVYLHGLCKDDSFDYPQVIPCQSYHDHEGVGVSLNNDFKSVPWVAVPGRDFFFNGNKSYDDELSEADIQSLVDKSIKYNIFGNVASHFDFVSKHEMNSYEHHKAATINSIGTDIAINWARELRCIKIPVTEIAIEHASNYLNEVNQSYFLTGKDYVWSAYTNNCTHLSLNIGHSMGLNSEIKVNQSFLRRISNLAVPANAFLFYVDLTVNSRLTSKRFHSNSDYVNAYNKSGFIPNQFGTLIELYPAYPSNFMFRTESLGSLTLPRRGFGRTVRTLSRYDHFFDKPEYTNLEENAQYWSKNYSQILKSTNNDEVLEDYIHRQLDLILSSP